MQREAGSGRLGWVQNASEVARDARVAYHGGYSKVADGEIGVVDQFELALRRTSITPNQVREALAKAPEKKRSAEDMQIKAEKRVKIYAEQQAKVKQEIERRVQEIEAKTDECSKDLRNQKKWTAEEIEENRAERVKALKEIDVDPMSAERRVRG